MSRHAFTPTSRRVASGLRLFVLFATVVAIPLAAVVSRTPAAGEAVGGFSSIAGTPTGPPNPALVASRRFDARAVSPEDWQPGDWQAEDGQADDWRSVGTGPAAAAVPAHAEEAAVPPAGESGEPTVAGREFPGEVGEERDALLHRLQHRLRALGVSYMRLGLQAGERSGAVYHFHCRLPVPDNPLYSRPFDARASEPLLAMQRVLRDVEAWQAARGSLAER